jgi:hypothetical protein
MVSGYDEARRSPPAPSSAAARRTEEAMAGNPLDSSSDIMQESCCQFRIGDHVELVLDHDFLRPGAKAIVRYVGPCHWSRGEPSGRAQDAAIKLTHVLISNDLHRFC